METIWTESDNLLYDAAIKVVDRFAREHPGSKVCCFFFDCDDPCYGHIGISLDTPENNMRSAIRLESFAVMSRRKMLGGDDAWMNAEFQLKHPVLSVINTNSGDFAFQAYGEVDFPEWERIANEGARPQSDIGEDEYLNSNARLVMWRVAERLVEDSVFDRFNLSTPFVVGYSLHDQEECILRLLNWPKPE